MYVTADIPPVVARFRAEVEDFDVEEVPAYAASGTGTHTYVTIEKRGVATLEAVRRIARRLGRKPGEIGFAGLKDARAVARQRISIEHLKDEDRAKIGDEQVRALSFERHKNKIQKGHLTGNRFKLRLREYERGSLEAARAALSRLRGVGVPNRFGQQRFGGVRDATHKIGLAMLRGRFDEAISFLLGRPEDAERARLREARTAFDQGDRARSLELFPHDFRAERSALRALLDGADAERALRAIPHQERSLYASAAQAAIFNDLLDARVAAATLGRLETGDVALIHQKGACFVVGDAAVEQPRAETFEVSPAGPLFGPKLLAASGAPAEREAAALAAAGLTLESFGSRLLAGLDGARRAYRVPLADASAERDGADLIVSFLLPAGAYATTVVSELFKCEMG